jgi:hypothetical protein
MPAIYFIFTGDLASRIHATLALWGDSPFGRLFKLSMDLLGSFGYAPSMASMALLAFINPIAISDFGVVLPTNTLKRLEEWR